MSDAGTASNMRTPEECAEHMIQKYGYTKAAEWAWDHYHGCTGKFGPKYWSAVHNLIKARERAQVVMDQLNRRTR